MSGRDLTGTALHIVDLGADVVAQEQPDGHLEIAVRPDQSFRHAVQKVREAIAEARAGNRADVPPAVLMPSAESVRQLLRPHWPESARSSIDDLLNDQERPRPKREPMPPEASVRVPLRRRSVQLWVLGAIAATFTAGALTGWQTTTAVTAVTHEKTPENVAPPFSGPAFEAFEAQGGNCRETGPGHGTCIDVDGVTLIGSSYAGADSILYNFYYDGGVRVTFVLHEEMGNAVLSAQAEGPMGPGPAYLVGSTLISGHEEAKVDRYARILADATGYSVMSYDDGRGFPPKVIYDPPG